MKSNIDFSTLVIEPPYKVQFSDFYGGTPQTRLLRFSFIDGYEYKEHEWITVGIGMSTDGTKEFYVNLEGTIRFEDSSVDTEFLEEYPIELLGSGITTDYGNGWLDGWVDILVFGDIHHVIIEEIKYTKGY